MMKVKESVAGGLQAGRQNVESFIWIFEIQGVGETKLKCTHWTHTNTRTYWDWEKRAIVRNPKIDDTHWISVSLCVCVCEGASLVFVSISILLTLFVEKFPCQWCCTRISFLISVSFLSVACFSQLTVVTLDESTTLKRRYRLITKHITKKTHTHTNSISNN